MIDTHSGDRAVEKAYDRIRENARFLGPEYAGDTLQDVALKMVEHSAETKPPVYWGRAARNNLLNRIRKEKNGQAVLQVQQARAVIEERQSHMRRTLYELVVISLLSESMEKSINGLDEKYRPLFVDKYFGGLTYEELATKYNLSPGTVKSRINRGLQVLKRRMRSFDKKTVASVAHLVRTHFTEERRAELSP